MKINKNENNDFYDVDDTLIMHEDPTTIPSSEKVEVLDPVTKRFITMRVNKPMVRLLRESAHRGACVKVWSRGGWEWAANVIKALDLVTCVDEVMSKPMAYFDDTPIEKWLPYRVWIAPDKIYKQTPLTNSKK